MAEVRRLDAPALDQEKREVEIHLRVWRARRTQKRSPTSSLRALKPAPGS